MKLLSPVSLGALELAHRVVMRALEGACRLRADGVPDERMSHYYLRRASAGGLIIAEPTSISLQGTRSPHAPGIYTAEQLQGWGAEIGRAHV